MVETRRIGIPAPDPHYLKLVQSGLLGIPKSKWDATTVPGTGDDITFGYKEGSFWYNTATNTLYYCTSNAKGAATWTSVAAGGGHDLVTLAADAKTILGLRGQGLPPA